MPRELYFSCDIETDGPVPGNNSMLSLGCACFTLDPKAPDGGHLRGTFSVNLVRLLTGVPDAATTEWWNRSPANQAAFKRTRENVKDPHVAVQEFVHWIEERLSAESGYKPRPVFVGWPATYDFMWVYWYLMAFNGSSPFRHSGFDIKTAATVMLDDARFSTIGKRGLPDQWKGPERHTHVAVEDAVEQGWLFCRMMRTLAE